MSNIEDTVLTLVCEELDDELTGAERDMVLTAFDSAWEDLISEFAQQVLASRNGRSQSGSGASAKATIVREVAAEISQQFDDTIAGIDRLFGPVDFDQMRDEGFDPWQGQR